MNANVPTEDDIFNANEFLIAVSSFYKKTEKVNDHVKSKATTAQSKVTTAQSKTTAAQSKVITSQSKATTKAFKTKLDEDCDESTSKKRPCINQKQNMSMNIQTDTTQQQKQSSDQPIYVSNQKKLWHKDDQYTIRTSVCLTIEQELKKNFHPDHANVVAKKLALAIKRIDDYLYCSANSLDEYKNETTLKLRLEQIHLQLTSKLSSRSTVSSTTSLPIQQVPQSVPIIHQKLIVENEKQQMDHKAEILRQQQQRLLMLRHASKCTNENGMCTFSASCHAMKILWHHIKSCKDNNCKTKHCISSKYVLSHYSNCKDNTCERCFPVRDAMRNSDGH